MPYYPNIKEKKLKYKEAPSGYININKWVPPFKKNEEGHGFMGIINEDTKTGQLQCHICGEWHEQLSTHITFKHKMTTDEYRDKFGLLRNTALKSKRIRLIHSKTIKNCQKRGTMNLGNREGYGFSKNNKYAGNRKGKKKAEESANRFGRCELQIAEAIIKLKNKLGKTPKLIDIQKEYGQGLISTITLRYKSYIKYCKDILNIEPGRSSKNPLGKEKWKELILKEGAKKQKRNEKLKTTDLSKKTRRYIYKYFNGIEEFNKELIKWKKNENRRNIKQKIRNNKKDSRIKTSN